MINARNLKLGAMSLCVAFAVIAFAAPAAAQETTTAQTAWRLLDYVSVDYAGAVQGGKVLSASEFAEMNEFGEQISAHMAGLPPTTARPELLAKAKALQAAIAAKSDPAFVAGRAHGLASDLLLAYPTPLAPDKAPDLVRGALLYQEHCAACHGATGHAEGPAAASLTPPPIAFADVARVRQRSVFGLYQVIQQGLDGTSMASFARLPSNDRWDLAFYVGRFAFSDEEAKAGATLFAADPSLRARFPDLSAVTQSTPAALALTVGEPKARALTAYLRRHPDITGSSGGSLDIARAKLSLSLAAYAAGDLHKASELALAAYLDGFEPIEPALRARDAALMERIEAAMGDVRGAIGQRAPEAEVGSQIERLDALFTTAGRALAPEKASAASSFVGAFTILLREGLEALLIVVAMIAFLQKADRRDVLGYVRLSLGR